MPARCHCVSSHQSVAQGSVENNIVDLTARPTYTHQSPLLQIESPQLYYFNNQASDGTVISGTDRDASNMFLGGLNNRVDEAFMLAYL